MSKPNSRTSTPTRKASPVSRDINPRWDSSRNTCAAKESPLRRASRTSSVRKASVGSNREILMSPYRHPGSARCSSADAREPNRADVNKRSQSLLGSTLNRKIGLMSTPNSGNEHRQRPFNASPRSYVSNGHSDTKMGTSERAVDAAERAAMDKRVRQLMRLTRPLHGGNSGFRIGTSDEDLKLLHHERVTRDPHLKGGAIKVNKLLHQNQDSMYGILSHCDSANSSCERHNSNTPKRIQRYHTPSSFRGGGMVPSDDEPTPRHRRSFNNLNEREAPWKKEVPNSPLGRYRSPNIRETSDIFSLNPITTPNRHLSQSRKNISHDVYRDFPCRTFQTLIYYPSPRVIGRKNGEIIKEEMANEPPMELPPRRRPHVTIMEGSRTTHDVLNQRPIEQEKRLFGRKIVDSPLRMIALQNSGSNPNEMVNIHPDAPFRAPYRSVNSKLKGSNDIIVYKDPPIDHSLPRGRKLDHKNAGCNWDRVVTNKENPSKRDEDKIKFLQSSPYRKTINAAAANMTSTIAHEPFGSGVDESAFIPPVSIGSWSPGIDGRTVSRRMILGSYKHRNSTIHNCLSWD
eukprot:Tbor_TRINITY_DN4350_c0_g1::TRINITY_DN4350_c0_g1_i1::g.7831::m.7831